MGGLLSSVRATIVSKVALLIFFCYNGRGRGREKGHANAMKGTRYRYVDESDQLKIIYELKESQYSFGMQLSHYPR